jgi:hypothetical protein
MVGVSHYERLLCHTMTVYDLQEVAPDDFTGSKSDGRQWIVIAERIPCRVGGSPAQIQQLTGRQASAQDFLLHTLYAGLKPGMRVKIEQPEFADDLYEVGKPVPVYGAEHLHHYEVVIRLIDAITGREDEI